MSVERFIAAFDLHYGYERKSGHKVALHDLPAWNAVLQFAADFKPHHFILGGDILDCGAISHHNDHKPGRTEGLRLCQDAAECRDVVLAPVEAVTRKSLTYITGNHEAWMDQFIEKNPALTGTIGVRETLKLGTRWKVVPQGDCHKLGKLYFIHGDQISGGVNAAKNAVEAYMENIRLGHFHTYQAATKTSAVDFKLGRTGLVVPCLCTKNPKYGQGKPNRWVQGFNFGFVETTTGVFSDYVAVIINGKFNYSGTIYGAA